MTQSVGSKGSGSFSIGPASRSGTSLDLAQGGGIGSRDPLQQQQQQQQPGQHQRRKTSDGVSGATGLDTSGRGVHGLDLSGRGGKRSSSGMRSLDLDISGRGLRGLDRSGRGKVSGDDRARSPPGDDIEASPGVDGEEAPVLDVSGRGLLRGASRRETVAVAREKGQGQGQGFGDEGFVEKQHVVDRNKGEEDAAKKTGMGKKVGSAPSGLQVTRNEILLYSNG